MIKSKLTAKAQTTIPQPVRAALRLKVGAEIVYQIEGERAVVTKAPTVVVDDPFATFSEWYSDADRAGYASLWAGRRGAGPVPYTDRDARQNRPALVVSNGGIGEGISHLWVVMITSATNRTWHGDVSLADSHEAAGLPVPSVVRDQDRYNRRSACAGASGVSPHGSGLRLLRS